MFRGVVCGFLCLAFLLLAACDNSFQEEETCEATPYDEIGPFYRPGAPVRSKVGSGFMLRGRVISTKGCLPLAESRIEFWLVNRDGQYDDSHRATVYSDKKGFYRFECNRPTVYVGRLPHIHMMVSAKGHVQLITQYYPKQDETEGGFDLVLEQEP